MSSRVLLSVVLAAVVAGAVLELTATNGPSARTSPPRNPFTKQVVACERSGKVICDPAAYRRDRREGMFALSKPDPKGGRLLTVAQVWPRARTEKHVAAALMTYRRASRIAPGLAAASSAVVNPSRKVWVITVYYRPPITVSDNSWELPPGVAATKVRVRAESQVDDAVTGSGIDSCVNCRAVPLPAPAGNDSPSCNYACTPPNQDALDADAGDAHRIAGRAYYTGAIIHADTNSVELYLAGAPQSVLDQLEAAHPGIYVIHDDAPHTSAALLKLEAGLDRAALGAEGIDVTEWGPTADGYLEVGVTSDVATAQEKLGEIYGPNVVHVVKAEPSMLDVLTDRSGPVGFLVGAIRTVGGPVGEWRRKGGGLATVFNRRGQAVAAERVRPGHDFRFRLAPGRYRLGLGRKGRKDIAGCPRGLILVRAGKTTHTDLQLGCDWP